MGDINTALTNFNGLITSLNKKIQDPATSATDKTYYEGLLDKANTAYTNVVGYTSTLLNNYNGEIVSKTSLENSLDDLKYITKKIDDDQDKVIDSLNAQKSTKMKEIQFNAYFAQMNNYNVNIMKILVLSSILMMVNIYLYTRKYISDSIYTIITIIIISITIIIISKMIYSEFQRSNYDFNTFKWPDPA